MVPCGDLATICIATLDVGFLNVSSGILRLIFAKSCVFWRRHDDGVPTLGVGLSQSLHMASRRFYYLYFRFWVGVFSNFLSNVIPRIICAKFGVFVRRRDAGRRFGNIVPYGIPRLFLAWFGIPSRRTLSIGFPASLDRICRLVSLNMSASRWFTSWRCSSVLQHRVLWLPWAHISSFGILSRRRFASVVSCVFSGVMNLGLALRRQALQRSASICQRLVLCLHWALVRFLWNLLSASRHLVSVCVYRVVRRLDVPLGFIWNWSRRCDGRCRDGQRRFDTVVSYGIPRLICCTYMESFVGVATLRFATLGIGLSVSCLAAFLGSSKQKWHFMSAL
jgi:hypothetical protein